eukprot:g4844.t1
MADPRYLMMNGGAEENEQRSNDAEGGTGRYQPMSVDAAERGGTGKAKGGGCASIVCSNVCFTKMSCIAGSITCTLLVVMLFIVSNVLSSATKIVSTKEYASAEFVSLTKQIVSTGGVKSEVWLMTVPESILGHTFLVSDAIQKGDGTHFIAGMPGLAYDGVPLYFALEEDRTALNVYLKQEALRASAEQDQTLLDVGADDRWLFTIPVLADTPGVAVVVQASTLLKSQWNIPVQEWSGNTDLINPALSRIVSAQCFARNCRLALELITGGGITMTSSLSMSLLPEEKMVPRQADKRIGYFQTAFTDIGVHSASASGALKSEVDKDYHFIHRWKLEKSKDCDSRDLCEPKKPIIYHIDPSIPKQWRPFIKKAVELWQPSFEALGFKDVPRARLPEDADWPADYDSADIRYSSIRMGIMVNGATAIGPTTVDPRTGEILDADISFPESWVSVFAGKYWPEMTTLSLEGSERGGNLRKTARRSHMHGHHNCAMEHFQQAAATTSHMMRALAAETSDGRIPFEVIGDGLTEVAVHEIGHTLGLRHNFKGSTKIPYTEIYNGEYTSKHGKTSSVMDYTAAVIAPTKKQQDTAIVFPSSKTVGEYDRLAIRYGYQVFAGEKAYEKHPGVVKVANEMSEMGLQYATDEDAPGSFNTDQLNKRYDLTDDPVSWVNDQFKIANRMIANANAAIQWDGSVVGYEAYGNYVNAALQLSAKRLDVLVNLLGGTTLNKQYPSAPPPTKSPSPLVRVVSSAYQSYLLDVIVSFITEKNYRSVELITETLASTGPLYSTTRSPTRQIFDLACASLFEGVLSANKLGMVARTHFTEANGGEVWSPPSWEAPSSSQKGSLLTPYDVIKRLIDAVFWGQDAEEEPWKSPVEWPMQTQFINQLVHLHNATSQSSQWIEVHLEAELAMKMFSSELREKMKSSSPADLRAEAFLNRTLAALSL